VSRRTRGEGKGALEILEEAVHLLRRAPAACVLPFYLGSLPFVLGFLFFYLDMRQSAFAARRAGEASLGMALLYLWMKGWQAIFARRLRAHLSRGEVVSREDRGALRLFFRQGIVQPSSLFVLPLSMLITLPYGWVYAFYQSVTVTGGIRASRRQAERWPKQNHVILLILALFGLCIFINLGMTLAAIPALLKALLGVETRYSRSPISLSNSTFLMLVLGLTYLVTAPLVKAVYVLRCFYGDSLASGEDLRADLKALQPAVNRGTAAVLLVVILSGASGATFAAGRTRPAAPDRPRTAAPGGLAPADLDDAIDKVLARREFAWRLPRKPPAAGERKMGFLERFLDSVVDTMGRFWDGIMSLVARIAAWLDEFFLSRIGREPADGRSGAWLTSVQGLMALLLFAGAAALGIFLWRSKRRRPAAVSAEALSAAPDLEIEDSEAAGVPADAWLDRATDLAHRGDLRQAVRAIYLGSLSSLARRDLIAPARFKSNRDYEWELRRRARSRAHLPELFAQNVAIFERVWYGRHEATRDLLERVLANHRGIDADASV
jgi:uncharacterized protein DUF4129